MIRPEELTELRRQGLDLTVTEGPSGTAVVNLQLLGTQMNGQFVIPTCDHPLQQRNAFLAGWAATLNENAEPRFPEPPHRLRELTERTRSALNINKAFQRQLNEVSFGMMLSSAAPIISDVSYGSALRSPAATFLVIFPVPGPVEDRPAGLLQVRQVSGSFVVEGHGETRQVQTPAELAAALRELAPTVFPADQQLGH